MDLMIDDTRNLSVDIIARTYNAGKTILQSDIKIDELWLDHDLGEDKTGYDILNEVIDIHSNLQKPKFISIITSSPVGREKMILALTSRFSPYERTKSLSRFVRKCKVVIMAYKKHIIIKSLQNYGDEKFILSKPGEIDCVLIDTKETLKMSVEALKLIKNMKISYDGISDLAVWKSEQGKSCIGWLGHRYQIINTEKSELTVNSDFDIDFQIIDNGPSQNDIVNIENMIENKSYLPL